MSLSVNLPKRVAIRNKRLAIFHFSMVGTILIGVFLLKFGIGKEYIMHVPIRSEIKVEWDMETSIRNMEQFFATNEEAEAECLRLPDEVGTVERWGYEWTVKSECTQMCTIDQVISHEAWNSDLSASPAMRLCWSDFKRYGENKKYTPLQFLQNNGGGAATLITAKNDWIATHAPTQSTSNHVEIVPQGMSARLSFQFDYELAQKPPWFFFTGQSSAKTTGTNENARLLILDSSMEPWGDMIQPGPVIELHVEEVLSLAKHPQGAASETEVADIMKFGAQVSSMVRCFSTDADIVALLSPDARQKSWTFDASLQDPVCVLSFSFVRTTYQVDVVFGPTDQTDTAEVVSETNGIYFEAQEGVGNAQMYSVNYFLVQLTSMLVLIAIPKNFTRFIAMRALGPLSNMYRRALIEPYDIEAGTASTVTLLASNMKQFHTMKQTCQGGQDVVPLKTIEGILSSALEARRDTMNEKEVMSLAQFCYESMASRELKTAGPKLNWLLASLEDLDIGFKRQAAQTQHEHRNSIKSKEGITMDQYNQIALDGGGVTFDEIVELFDKDRNRGILEVLFTPQRIREALIRASDEGDKRHKRWTEKVSVKSLSSMKSFVRHDTVHDQARESSLRTADGPLEDGNSSLPQEREPPVMPASAEDKIVVDVDVDKDIYLNSPRSLEIRPTGAAKDSAGCALAMTEGAKGAAKDSAGCALAMTEGAKECTLKELRVAFNALERRLRMAELGSQQARGSDKDKSTYPVATEPLLEAATPKERTTLAVNSSTDWAVAVLNSFADPDVAKPTAPVSKAKRRAGGASSNSPHVKYHKG